MLDLTKPCQTRDGRAVRILATDLNYTGYPIVGAVSDSRRGTEYIRFFSTKGRAMHTGPDGCDDLVNVVTQFRLERWVNIYPASEASTVETIYVTKEAADKAATSGRMACIRFIIEGREGDGL